MADSKNGANCWEQGDCNVFADCPAYPRNGRTCFAIEGTLCRGEKQGAYADKIGRCRKQCDFYKQITARK